MLAYFVNAYFESRPRVVDQLFTSAKPRPNPSLVPPPSLGSLVPRPHPRGEG